MRVVTICGIRPDFIRLSSIIKLLDDQSGINHTLIHTGQHYTHNVNDIFFEELNIRQPNINLKIEGETQIKRVASILSKLEDALLKIKPDVCIFLGDCDTALGSIVSNKLNIFTIHIEAGMRSHDPRMQEEKNRILIDHCANLHYVYTERYKENLLHEGFAPQNIVVVGNPIVDIVKEYKGQAYGSGILRKLKLEQGGYFLTTIHRAENVDDKKALMAILKGLELVSQKYKKPIIFPMYYRTQKRIKEMGLSKHIPKGVQMMDPLGFLEFLDLEGHSACNLTDSGTVVEESLILKVPCVTARWSTERPETVEVGANIVAGTDSGAILKAVVSMIETKREWDITVLGDGKSSIRIVSDIKRREKQIMGKEHLKMDPYDFRKRNCFVKQGGV